MSDHEGDVRRRLGTAQAEARRLEAENRRLAEERRAARLETLRNELTGKMPGRAVNAFVECVREMDIASPGAKFEFSSPLPTTAYAGQRADVIERAVTIAKDLPFIVEMQAVDVRDHRAGQEDVEKARKM